MMQLNIIGEKAQATKFLFIRGSCSCIFKKGNSEEAIRL